MANKKKEYVDAFKEVFADRRLYDNSSTPSSTPKSGKTTKSSINKQEVLDEYQAQQEKLHKIREAKKKAKETGKKVDWENFTF